MMIPRDRVPDVVTMVVRIGAAIQRRQGITDGDNLSFLDDLSDRMLKLPITESLLDGFLFVTNNNPNSLDDNDLISALRNNSAFREFVSNS